MVDEELVLKVLCSAGGSQGISPAAERFLNTYMDSVKDPSAAQLKAFTNVFEANDCSCTFVLGSSAFRITTPGASPWESGFNRALSRRRCWRSHGSNLRQPRGGRRLQ